MTSGGEVRRSGPALATAERVRLVGQRLSELRNVLSGHAGRAIVLDTRRDFAWLTVGGQNHVLASAETGVAPVVVTPDDAVVIAPVNEFDRLGAEEVDGLPLRLVSVPWWDRAAAEAAVTQISGGRDRVLRASEIGVELEALRTALDEHEHVRLEWLAGAARHATADVLAATRPGSTENELAAGVVASLTAVAARVPVVLVASDERIERFRHPLSSEKAIERRVMVVVVAERWGLHVAHTEFREFRERPPALERRAAALAEVLTAMRGATQPGNTLDDVLGAARAAYERTEMADEWTLHHQGGTIGYQARERVATPGDRTPIRVGMAFAWNPSAVGFKREETLYLDAHGARRILTTTPG